MCYYQALITVSNKYRVHRGKLSWLQMCWHWWALQHITHLYKALKFSKTHSWQISAGPFFFFSGLPEPFWRAALTQRRDLMYKFHYACSSWILYKSCGTWIKAIQISRQRKQRTSDPWIFQVHYWAFQKRLQKFCLLCEYPAADPGGDTERGAALLEGRIFFLS